LSPIGFVSCFFNVHLLRRNISKRTNSNENKQSTAVASVITEAKQRDDSDWKRSQGPHEREHKASCCVLGCIIIHITIMSTKTINAVKIICSITYVSISDCPPIKNPGIPTK
ncbi:hypothetical protein, partial [Oenococcus oeni]|uniref:hypothetical protein n=1 Tax=Oenococcus oeni TaxID=1247 RepID=UPI001C5BF7C2